MLTVNWYARFVIDARWLLHWIRYDTVENGVRTGPLQRLFSLFDPPNDDLYKYTPSNQTDLLKILTKLSLKEIYHGFSNEQDAT